MTIQTKPSNKKNLGLLLLLAGMALIAGNLYYYFAKPAATAIQPKTTLVQTPSDSLKPRFEVGYATISMAQYNAMKEAAANKERDLFLYPVFHNATDSLITAGHIVGDYSRPTTDPFLQGLPAAFKNKKAKLLGSSVACLIIKQVGKGKAEKAVLHYRYITLPQSMEIYDGLDILNYDTRRKWPQRQLVLGDMDTGSSWLVPLYITNTFENPVRDEESGALTCTLGPMEVPVTLGYAINGKHVAMDMEKVLERPVEIGE